MSIKTRRLAGSMAVVLAAVAAGAILLVGTALAQGGQPNLSGNGWGRGMMGDHRDLHKEYRRQRQMCIRDSIGYCNEATVVSRLIVRTL